MTTGEFSRTLRSRCRFALRGDRCKSEGKLTRHFRAYRRRVPSASELGYWGRTEHCWLRFCYEISGDVEPSVREAHLRCVDQMRVNLLLADLASKRNCAKLKSWGWSPPKTAERLMTPTAVLIAVGGLFNPPLWRVFLFAWRLVLTPAHPERSPRPPQADGKDRSREKSSFPIKTIWEGKSKWVFISRSDGSQDRRRSSTLRNTRPQQERSAGSPDERSFVSLVSSALYLGSLGGSASHCPSLLAPWRSRTSSYCC
jgi:hypothetical protein